MNKTEQIDFVGREKVIGILRTDNAEQAVQAGKAMAAGGLKVIEVTFTISEADKAIRQLVEALPDVLIGAGSVTTVCRCERALSAGAKFIVSPNFLPEVVDMTLQADRVSCPGVLTATEIVNAHNAGADILKIYPINCMGGVAYLKAVRGPLPDYRYCPTSGVNADTVGDYLKAGAFCTGAGGKLVPMDAVREGDFEKVTESASAFIAARDKALAEMG
jgi:2-dehydro-3-deoxyphosphogluconate aldolase / (4S)-4-hydroxy-2-oxoglutarate aldolase